MTRPISVAVLVLALHASGCDLVMPRSGEVPLPYGLDGVSCGMTVKELEAARPAADYDDSSDGYVEFVGPDPRSWVLFETSWERVRNIRISEPLRPEAESYCDVRLLNFANERWPGEPRAELLVWESPGRSFYIVRLSWAFGRTAATLEFPSALNESRARPLDGCVLKVGTHRAAHRVGPRRLITDPETVRHHWTGMEDPRYLAVGSPEMNGS